MLDVEKLRKENELARQEISEYYEKNSIKNHVKEWIANHSFFSKLANTNIFGLFWPNYDNKEYGNGDSILQYVLYCIFNFFITVSLLKIGFIFGGIKIKDFLGTILYFLYILLVPAIKVCLLHQEQVQKVNLILFFLNLLNLILLPECRLQRWVFLLMIPFAVLMMLLP